MTSTNDIKIYQSYIKVCYMYIEYIKVEFKIYMECVKAILQMW